MTRFFPILLLLFLLASFMAKADALWVSPPFESYYHDFVTLSKKNSCVVYDKLMFVTFDDEDTFVKIGPNVVGVCYWETDWRYVTIKKSYWDTIGEFQRRILIYHELGHCLLNRQHLATTLDGQCPKSLMNPSVVAVECSDYKELYFRELFQTQACPKPAKIKLKK